MRQLLAAVLLAGLLLTAPPANANSMGGLIFVVVIWPVGVLCGVLLLTLGVIGLVKLQRGASPGLASALLVSSIAVGVLYPLVSVALGSAAPIGVLALSILPVEVLAVACAVLSVILRRRVRGQAGTA